jgi:hypothetical protein
MKKVIFALLFCLITTAQAQIVIYQDMNGNFLGTATVINSGRAPATIYNPNMEH